MKKRKRRVSKTDYQLYKIARKYAGKTLNTKEVDKIFGRSPRCINITKRSSLFKFIKKGKYSHPAMYWIVRDEIAVTYKDLPDSWRVTRIIKVKKGVGGNHGGYVMGEGVHILKKRTKILFLIPPEQISFWKLKQYGGWL